MQRILKAKQPLAFFLGKLADRHLGPDRDHARNILRRHRRQLLLLCLLCRLPEQLLKLLLKLVVTLSGCSCRAKPSVDNSLCKLLILCSELLLKLCQRVVFLLHRILQANRCAGFINDINGLVRKVAVIDIALRQTNCLLHGLPAHMDLMMLLVARNNSLQNLQRLCFIRLLHLNRLETSLQCGIPLDILVILIDGRRTDHLNLASCKSRLQNVRGINGALCSAGSDQRVHLIHKQNNIARIPNLFDDALDAFLKFAAVFGACHHAGQIQRKKALSLHRSRNLSPDNLLGKSLYDGRFADAGLTDQAGIVLCPSGQNLNHPLHLRLASYHGIHGPALRLSGQIAAVHLQHILSAGSAVLSLLRVAGQILPVLLEIYSHCRQRFKINLGNVCSRSLHQLQCYVLTLQNGRKKKELCSELLHMILLFCKLHGAIQDVTQPGSIPIPVHDRRVSHLQTKGGNHILQLLFRNSVVLQYLRGNSRLLPDHAKKQMLRSDISASVLLCRLFGKPENLPGILCIRNAHTLPNLSLSSVIYSSSGSSSPDPAPAAASATQASYSSKIRSTSS